MQTVEIDFDVFKALTAHRKSERETYNDVIRKLLGLTEIQPERTPSIISPTQSKRGMTCKSVFFPEGTDFRASYKGQTFYGKVEGFALVINGKRTDSLSSAASVVTGTSVNGWGFWECRMPGENGWRLAKFYRKTL